MRLRPVIAGLVMAVAAAGLAYSAAPTTPTSKTTPKTTPQATPTQPRVVIAPGGQQVSLPADARARLRLPPPPPPPPRAQSCATDPDADRDGASSMACGGLDCDDSDPTRTPGRPEIADAGHHDEDCDFETFGNRDSDRDGFFDSNACNYDPASGWHCGNDCDDFRRDVNPNAPEVCDSLDNNCDGGVDDRGVAGIYYTDADGDGFGRTTAPLNMCYATPGVSHKNTDCNDADALVHPGQFEIADSIDNNCNGAIDEDPKVAPLR
jgi:hypothetical protein